MPTVFVAGGGTGGHIFPGIAIARELTEREPGCEVVFIGTERGLETRIVPAEGFRLLTIRSAGITGKSVTARMRGLGLIPVSLVQCLLMIRRHRPVLVIGVGGYASGPVLAAAVACRVPTLIHEQNFVPGVTNRWMAPHVTEVAVTFAETIERLGGRGRVLGNPVRKEFTLVKPRPKDEKVKCLLIYGGSQGARVINQAVRDALPSLAPLRERLRVIHQTGEKDLEGVKRAWSESGFPAERVDVRPFITDMSRAYEKADLILSRSGATTVAELTASGRPAILVPFARATHDHQTFNARKLVDAGAAVMIAEQELSGARLAGAITDLIGDPGRLASMSRASLALGRPDAGARIAEVCQRIMKRGRAA